VTHPFYINQSINQSNQYWFIKRWQLQRTLEQMSQKKVQNTKYMTMYDKIKSYRIGEFDTAE